ANETPTNPLGFLANDSDPNRDAINANLATGPSHGTLDLHPNPNGPGFDGLFTYTPDHGYVGSDIFTYTVLDGNGGQATGTVYIDVINNPPVAVNDSYTVGLNGTLTVDAMTGLLANDSDPNGDTITVDLSSIIGPSQATLNLDASGSFIYTANSGMN